MVPTSEPTPADSDAPCAMDRVIAAYMRDVDRSLLRENLAKTPEERVVALMRLQRIAREARAAGERLRGH